MEHDTANDETEHVLLLEYPYLAVALSGELRTGLVSARKLDGRATAA